MNIYAIILAAGKGTRMKSLLDYKSKVSYEILGVPLVKYVLDSISPLNPKKTVVVVGFGGETTKSICEPYADIVWQKEQKGTGHAVMQAGPVLESEDGCTIITCGDTPLLSSSTLSELVKEHESSNNDLTVLSAIVPNPFGYGRIIRKEDGTVLGIVEQSDASEEQKLINEVNTGVCIYNNKLLFEYLNKLQPNNAKGEYYLTDLLKMFVNDGLKVGVSIMEDYKEMAGINDRSQLADAANEMKYRINKKHMLSGVTLIDPNNTYIGPYVKIEPDTIIYPGTSILGTSSIGKENEIKQNSYLVNVNTGDKCIINTSYLENTQIGENEVVPPFSVVTNQK